MLSDASNLSNHGQCAQKHILDRTDLDIFEEKEFMKGSQYHLLESMDALYPIDDSVVLEGKEEAKLCIPKDKSKYSGCRVDDQVQSFKECVDDLGEWTFNTVKKQKKEDCLSDLAASHNDDSRYLKHLDIVKDPMDHFFLKKTSQVFFVYGIVALSLQVDFIRFYRNVYLLDRCQKSSKFLE